MNYEFIRDRMKNDMKRLIVWISSVIVLLVYSGMITHAFGYEKVAGESATFASLQVSDAALKEDPRVTKLRQYLEQYQSPLSAHAELLVEEADRNTLDWRLVAAIAGLESGFGKHIPQNSFNGWGWGVYGDQVHRFSSWEDAISTISKGLRTNYMDKWKATDVYSIGRYYAASPTWARRVTYFMNQIDTFEEKKELAIIPFTL